MKIEDKSKEKCVTFDTLMGGDAFMSEGKHYIKLDVVVKRNEVEYVSVRINDGFPCYFFPDTKVIKLNAKVVIGDD